MKAALLTDVNMFLTLSFMRRKPTNKLNYDIKFCLIDLHSLWIDLRFVDLCFVDLCFVDFLVKIPPIIYSSILSKSLFLVY